MSTELPLTLQVLVPQVGLTARITAKLERVTNSPCSKENTRYVQTPQTHTTRGTRGATQEIY